MRKIKELEARIDRLERLEICDSKMNDNRYDIIIKQLLQLSAIESKQKEQEEFLKNTVAPFIANAIAKELGGNLTGLIDALADLFAEEPKKKMPKKSKDEKKKVGRLTQKKENK